MTPHRQCLSRLGAWRYSRDLKTATPDIRLVPRGASPSPAPLHYQPDEQSEADKQCEEYAGGQQVAGLGREALHLGVRGVAWVVEDPDLLPRFILRAVRAVVVTPGEVD